VSADAVGIVCERAPDAAAPAGEVLGFTALFGERSSAIAEAAQLAHILVENEPASRGVQQLRVFEETLVGELEPVLLALRLRDRLRAGNFSRCEIDADCWLAGYADILRDDLQVVLRASSRASRQSRGGRVLARVLRNGFSRPALAREWRQLLDHVDPYHRRARLFAKSGRDWAEGEIWFYSTARTFTNVGLSYEPYSPAPFRFLIESVERGGEPLKGRPSVSIGEFVTPACAPSHEELQKARIAIERHAKGLALTGAHAQARDALLRGPYFAQFIQRLLPLGLFYARLFEEWCARTRPAALMVGNFVFEAYALHAARRHGVPTVLLQHGTTGIENSALDPAADQVVVRGPFWAEFLPENVRRRTQILNVPEPNRLPAPAERKSLLFLTAPYFAQKFWDDSELDDILTALLDAATDAAAEFIVRVHPLEDVRDYRRRLAKLTRATNCTPTITFSQGGPLDPLLQRSAVCVTYSSTAFMDCLRWRVPLVSPGWHDFTYRRAIERHGVFHFADSLANLRRLLRDGLSGDLPCADETALEAFAAATPPDELAQEFERMLRGRTRETVPERTLHACNA